MKIFTTAGLRTAVLSVLLASLSACNATFDQTVPETEFSALTEAELSAVSGPSPFPYHPLVYHLDLSILAYQLYGQSLAWPFDPYYEERNGATKERDGVMAKVQRWAMAKGAEQVAADAGLKSFRGPGSLNGFDDNPTHDPIIYDYNLIHPWSNTLTLADGIWTEYLTPKSITRKISKVNVCYRPPASPVGSVTMRQIKPASGSVPREARDTLWVFEGGTGDKGEPGQSASQSVMGFVLLRNRPEGGYDAHIAFRGSRSGSAGRAIKEAFSDRGANGNPDWITDLGYNRLTSGETGSLISTVGQVSRGFATSMRSILPNLMYCLNKAAATKKGVDPSSIFVTGHSLGGALAQDFVAAMLLGNRYGPSGKGPGMPKGLSSWPWANIKLITYGAPRVGDAEFAKELTVKHLRSEQFATALAPVDRNALNVTDTSILVRLRDPDRPAGFRVLNSKDPITTEKIVGGKHVGKTVYVNKPRVKDAFSPPDFSAHEQRQIRDYMLGSLKDGSIPKLAIRYVEMDAVNPSRSKKDKGTRTEMRKLAASLSDYYTRSGTWFDNADYERRVDLRFSIADQP